jgi:hypothetical protein
MDGHPTVLWTGNGYHIYQPMAGPILEETDIFARFNDLKEKILPVNSCSLHKIF